MRSTEMYCVSTGIGFHRSFIPYIFTGERIENMNFETLYDRLINGEEKLALIGLGYVGMPIAVEFAKHVKVIGFNHNEKRIQQYKSGVDPTHEVGDEAISKTTVDFTSDET